VGFYYMANAAGRLIGAAGRLSSRRRPETGMRAAIPAIFAEYGGLPSHAESQKAG
jgi:hypothetical protein